MTEWTVRGVFEPGGLISEHLEGYEMREPQRDLAVAIEEGMARGEHVVAEGPTGTGKSLAYLVPAIQRISGADSDDDDRVVVATANIALQEQLVEKDLPFLAKVLPNNFSFALVKGRNNYLCIDKLESFRMERAQGEMSFGGGDKQLAFGEDTTEVSDEVLFPLCSPDEKAVLEWSKRTEFGDKSELEINPAPEVWRQFSVTAEECLSSACPFHDICFANKARAALQEIDVVVVNYHMLYAAIEMRRQTTKDIVLPPFKYLILDEAHRAADIARDFFGWQISEWSVNRLRGKLDRYTKRAKALARDEVRNFSQISFAISAALESMLGGMAEFYGDRFGAASIKQEGVVKGLSLAERLGEASDAFGVIAKSGLSERDKADAKKQKERAAVMADNVREVVELRDPNGVYYMEKAGKTRKLRLVKRMLDVSDFMWEQMFSYAQSVVLTSATMAIDGNCAYIRGEIGMKEGREVVVESPFDFKKQGLIILSAKAPDPKAKDYPDKVSQVTKVVIEQAGGRTLGLFTSYRVLNHVAEYLRAEMPEQRFLVHGEAPRMKLVADFKEDVSSVLLGTESFWAGVDVPGEACSCVIIDKIPFPSPGDPVLDALNDRCDGQGFWQVSIPRAVLQLRQGAGRLIRRRDDSGVVVILDNRLVTKRYGHIFVNSLPPFRRASSLKNRTVERWLGGDR